MRSWASCSCLFDRSETSVNLLVRRSLLASSRPQEWHFSLQIFQALSKGSLRSHPSKKKIAKAIDDADDNCTDFQRDQKLIYAKIEIYKVQDKGNDRQKDGQGKLNFESLGIFGHGQSAVSLLMDSSVPARMQSFDYLFRLVDKPIPARKQSEPNVVVLIFKGPPIVAIPVANHSSFCLCIERRVFSQYLGVHSSIEVINILFYVVENFDDIFTCQPDYKRNDPRLALIEKICQLTLSNITIVVPR